MTQWGLDTLFNPAKRHMDEEKRRLQATREEIGDASGGRRVDLESGKVTINRDGADDVEDDAPSSKSDEVVDESPAKARARKRIEARRAAEAAKRAE